MIRVRLICNYYRDPMEAEKDIARQQPDGIRVDGRGRKTMFILTLKRGNTLRALWGMVKLWLGTKEDP